MSTTGYVELVTAEGVDDLETEVGQRYAASIGKEWPMPPDIVGPGAYPCGLSVPTPYDQLPPERKAKVFRQTHYTRALRYEDRQGGVLAVDETLDSIDDLELTKVQKAQLSGKAQALVDAALTAEVGG